MSGIQEQILALQRKQAKIDEYKAILTELDGRPDSPQHKDLKVEIFSQLSTFINEKITELETGVETKPKLASATPGVLSQAEIDLFRTYVLRTATGNGASPAENDPMGPPVPPKPKAPVLDPNDPLRFMMAHKHLDGKRVSFQSKDGEIFGKVVGLVAPNVMIVTDTGFEFNIEPSRLRIAVGGK